MQGLTLVGSVWLGIGLALPLLVLVVNPLLVYLVARRVPWRPIPVVTTFPSVSMIVAVHNGASLMETKLDNALALDYPPAQLEIIVVADGCSDATEQIVVRYGDRNVRLLRLDEHRGKTWALNTAVAEAHGELLVFSDADALLPAESLRQLVAPFAAPTVGGVCGQRVIGERQGALREAQARYINLDSRLKHWESRLGTLTSNDGKLYAIRRALFVPLPPAVTDDLFLALAVVRQGRGFVFAPQARALIPTPSRGAGHELERRRRIVAASLHGIRLQKVLLDPRRYGFFAWRLLINKVFRRLLPLALLLVMGGTLLLLPGHSWAWPLLLLQLLGYGLAFSHLLWPKIGIQPPPLLGKVSAAGFYVALGAYGTLLGIGDFLRGRQPQKWTPRKRDGV